MASLIEFMRLRHAESITRQKPRAARRCCQNTGQAEASGPGKAGRIITDLTSYKIARMGESELPATTVAVRVLDIPAVADALIHLRQLCPEFRLWALAVAPVIGLVQCCLETRSYLRDLAYVSATYTPPFSIGQWLAGLCLIFLAVTGLIVIGMWQQLRWRSILREKLAASDLTVRIVSGQLNDDSIFELTPWPLRLLLAGYHYHDLKADLERLAMNLTWYLSPPRHNRRLNVPAPAEIFLIFPLYCGTIWPGAGPWVHAASCIVLVVYTLWKQQNCIASRELEHYLQRELV